MKPIQHIYTEYKIMPNLQLHQLRVAAVAKMICINLTEDCKTSEVVTACLLHDMGNIIKFDLNYFPQFTQPEGLEYWQKVKDEYVEKYGSEEHIATQKIVQELNYSSAIVALVDGIGFSKLDQTLMSASLARKICAYADMRVGPHGIISIDERLEDGRKRYEGRSKALVSGKYELLRSALEEIEKQIFLNSKIKPEDINDAKVAPVIEELKTFQIGS